MFFVLLFMMKCIDGVYVITGIHIAKYLKETKSCLNMDDKFQNDAVHKLMDTDRRLIEQYQNEISLIHLHFNKDIIVQLNENHHYSKKRSHSEC